MSEDSPNYEVLYNHNTLIGIREFPNKIESIYTVTTVQNETGEHPRCVGFFSRFSDALHYINKFGINGLDEGGVFKYLVIEKFKEGIYAMSDEFEESWFEADFKDNNWKEIKKPSKFKGVINFGMG